MSRTTVAGAVPSFPVVFRARAVTGFTSTSGTSATTTSPSRAAGRPLTVTSSTFSKRGEADDDALRRGPEAAPRPREKTMVTAGRGAVERDRDAAAASWSSVSR